MVLAHQHPNKFTLRTLDLLLDFLASKPGKMIPNDLKTLSKKSFNKELNRITLLTCGCCVAEGRSLLY